MPGKLHIADPPPISWGAPVFDKQDTKARSLAVHVDGPDDLSKSLYFRNSDSGSQWNHGHTILDYQSDYTVAFWVRFDSLPGEGGYYHLFDVGDYGNELNRDTLNVNTSSGSTYFRVVRRRAGSGSGTNGTNAVSANQWYYVVLVGDASTDLKVYIDGSATAEATTTLAGTGGTAENAMMLGCYMGTSGDTILNDAQAIPGRLSSMKIWSAALTSAEFAQEMETVRPQRTSNIWGWYPWGGQSVWYDTSGNGRHWIGHKQGGGEFQQAPGPPISWTAMNPLWTMEEAGATLFFPISDDWTGSDFDLWDSTIWVTSKS